MTKRVNRDDIDKLHDYDVYIPTRTIYVGSIHVSDEGESGTDAHMAERLLKNIHILEALNKDPITIIFNNIGGDVNHGLAIYDGIKNSECHITIKVFGHAMSMGSIILQAADERLMSPNASQMIHYGKIKEKNPKFTLGQLRKMLDHDTFLTSKESVELGLADGVLETV